jgi:1,4-dihydroxy-2-naphthoate polyprenyltransferase
MKITPYVLAARPATLVASIAPVLIGTKIAHLHGERINYGLLFFCITSAMAIQIATNYYNDQLDYLQGADSSQRKGPKRMVASGIISAKQMQKAALCSIIVAIVLAIPLVAARGWPIIAIGIPSILFAYSYSGPPIKIAYRGLGEIFVVIFFGLIAVSGAAYVQAGYLIPESVFSGLQAGAIAASLIAINNLRDIDEDRISRKRTLAVRLGPKFARVSIVTFLTVPLVIAIMRHQSLSYLMLSAYLIATLTISALLVSKRANQLQNCLFLSAAAYIFFTLAYLS